MSERSIKFYAASQIIKNVNLFRPIETSNLDRTIERSIANTVDLDRYLSYLENYGNTNQ
jgi:hypothetical protein